MTTVTTTDPRTGTTTDTALVETDTEGVDRAVRASRQAAAALASLSRMERADLLEQIAAAVDAAAPALVEAALAETGLPEARLRGEVARSSGQFRLFADVVRDGMHVEAAIDHAMESPSGLLPDVRRMLVPVGPIAVFGASNFPFAFSVLGGDTASALAVACPVVAKAHPAHPLTSQLSIEVLRDALGVHEDAVTGVFGMAAGADLVRHPDIAAVTLTGSIGAARAIQALIDEREDPIPFYGELGSLNPLVILPGAAEDRPDALAEGLHASFTGSGGQLCTKPGLAYVPRDASGDHLVERLRELVGGAPFATMLTDGMRGAFLTSIEDLVAAGATVMARGSAGEGAGATAAPVLLTADTADVHGRIAEECFGPALILVRYDDTTELPDALRRLPAALTMTVHTADADAAHVRTLMPTMIERAGRVILNGFPTGVRVSWAQQHGGPWPATNSLHTSVGATATRRFLRPVAFQDVPDELLPIELREGTVDLPRRVDGVLVPAKA
ncbi:aldehyde dehydrogenase family protein [Clavibacter zhangzhiyongii]|uniref:aldehyde dehydrogenase family protein n=1 Tax=Clavibacter zhangzhiyongii TaxID=2768071 RepID=UPI0039E066C8